MRLLLIRLPFMFAITSKLKPMSFTTNPSCTIPPVSQKRWHQSTPRSGLEPKTFNMKKTLLTACLLACTSSFVLADIVYITSRPSPSGSGPNTDGTYTEQFPGLGDFGAAGTAPGRPPTSGAARTYISTPEITNPEYGVDLTPTFGEPGGIYQIDYNFNSVAGNTSTNVLMTVTALNGTLSFSQTDKFQRQFGNPANQWRFMGYITNDVGSVNPTISFRYLSGTISGASANRMIFDTWRFTLVEPCLAVATVNVTGPLATNIPNVVVTGVTNASKITVYQNSGSGMVQIGELTSGIVDGANTVPVTGLVKGARVAATQTVSGQEGCVPTTGTWVGGGANPSIRVALTIRETTDTGPIGAPAVNNTNTSLHFLGSSGLLGGAGSLNGAPSGGVIVNPSSGWQTVSFLRGTNEIVGDSANASGATANGSAYNPGEFVSIQVYAFRTLPNNVKIFSANPTTSTDVTSNDVFAVNWTWDAVSGADGYRVLRNYNFAGYQDYQDLAGNNLADTGAGWINDPLVAVTPTTSQSGSSIRWNPSVANTNNLPGQWGVLESINLAVENLEDTGPFDLYIDNLRNANTIWQTFENSVAGAQDVSFRAPSFSGTTLGNLLSAPNQSIVSAGAADTGHKSLRVRFQWANTNATRWLRLTTSGVGNPLVNLDEPISFRILLLPVNENPVAPPGPVLTIAQEGDDTVLNWTGAHRLQAASVVTGTYTNIPGVTLGPWTNTITEPQKFFRLVD
jgi:hypothetical protein